MKVHLVRFALSQKISGSPLKNCACHGWSNATGYIWFRCQIYLSKSHILYIYTVHICCTYILYICILYICILYIFTVHIYCTYTVYCTYVYCTYILYICIYCTYIYTVASAPTVTGSVEKH